MVGRTVEILSEKIDKSKNRGLTFIPLCGGLTSSGRTWQASNICQQFVHKTNGKFHLLNDPNYFNKEETKKAMLSEESINKIMLKGKNSDVALLGIGSISSRSTGILASGLSQEEINTLKEEGAVANISCSYINAEGQIIATCVSNKMLGHSIKDLQKAKKLLLQWVNIN